MVAVSALSCAHTATALAPPQGSPRILPTQAQASVLPEVTMSSAAVHDLAKEPFSLVQEDLRVLKRRIKALVERNVGAKEKTKSGSTNPLLQEAAKGFMERRERAWRPAVVLLVARALCVAKNKDEMLEKHIQLAEIVEMMSTAQIIHDDVIEDFETAEKGNVAHMTYSAELGNKVSLLAGDFLLARASVELAKLVNTEVVEIMGTSLENMCRGEIMQAQAYFEDKTNTSYYLEQVSLKTASLLADACRSAAILFGEDANSALATAAATYGLNVGIAYQICKDTDAFEDFQAGGSHTANSLAEMLALPPVALAASACPRLVALAQDGFTSDGAVEEALQLIQDHEGPSRAMAMAQEHMALARGAARELPKSPFSAALETMCKYVSEPTQIGLQRKEYIELQQKSQAARPASS